MHPLVKKRRMPEIKTMLSFKKIVHGSVSCHGPKNNTEQGKQSAQALSQPIGRGGHGANVEIQRFRVPNNDIGQ